MKYRHNFSLSKRHELILISMSKRLDISMVETIQRGLEALEEKEAKRDKDIEK